MKLYFSPGACCMSCHIALVETNAPFELIHVGKMADEKIRADFLKVNPLGAVPALELDNGKILTQNIAILEYIADQYPESNLLAQAGSYVRADTMRWLSFVASDLHKAFSPLFGLNKISTNETTQNDIKKWCFSSLDKYLSVVDAHLKNKTFFCGEEFTVADCYFYTVYRWTNAVSLPTEKYTEINRYVDGISKRPSVIEVLQKEKVYK